MKNRTPRTSVISAAAAATLLAAVVQADTVNWTAASGGSWLTPTNWTDVQTTLQHVPTSSDAATFPTALSSNVNLDFNSGPINVGSIIDNIAPTSSAASALTLSGFNTAGGSLILSGSTVTVSFNVTPTESAANVILSLTSTSTTKNKNLTLDSGINLTLAHASNTILTYAGQGSSSKVNSNNSMPIISIAGNISSGSGVTSGITFLGGGNIGGLPIAGGGTSAAVVGGELNLSGVNTFGGGLTIGTPDGSQGGTVDLLSATALPTSGTITVNEGGQLAFTGTTAPSAPLIFGAPGQNLVLNGIGANKTISGSIRPTGGTVANPVEWAGNIVLGSSAAADLDGGYVLTTVASGGSDFKVLGNITGPSTGGLIEQGGGVLELAGPANNYGATQVGNGGIVVDAGSNLSPGDIWLLQTSTNNPTITLNNAVQSVTNLKSSFTATGATVANNAGGFSQDIVLNGTTMTINQTVTGVFGYGNVVGLTSGITDGTQLTPTTGTAGSIVYNGSSTSVLVLSGPNKYTGGTIVKTGTLSLANLVPGTNSSTTNNSALGTGMVTVNGGATLATGGYTAPTGFNGNTSPVTVTSGMISGPLQVNAGGIVSPGNGVPGSLYVGSLNATAGSVFNFAIGSSVAGNYSTLVSTGAITLDPSGNETINITGSKLAVGTFTLVAGTSITGNNFVEGTTPAGINRQYTLTKSSDGTSEILTIVNTGIERDFSTTGASPAADGSGTFGQGATNFYQVNNGVVTNSVTYNNADAADTAFGDGGTGGQITIAAGGARVGGTLILGPLQSGSMYTFGTVGSSNAITTVGGVFASNSALVNAPVILGGSQTYSVDTNSTVTLTGGLSQSVTGSVLTKTGGGTLALTGTGSWTGGTILSAGILQTTTAGLPAAGGVVNNASLVFDQQTAGTTGTYTGLISGTGTVTVQNTGTVTLNNSSNTYTGQTIVAGGTLAVVNVGSLGTGDGGILLTGGTLQANADLSFPLNNGSTGAPARKLTLAAGTTSTVNASGHSVVFGQNITGQGNLTVNGGGSVTLTGVPSTTVIGSVAVGAGTNFVIAPPSLIPSFGFSFSNNPGTVAGNIVVATPIELRLYGGDLNGGGNLIIQPAGMLTTARANTTIDGGSGIVLNPSNTAGVSESIGASSGFAFTINGPISGNSAVDFTGGATGNISLGAISTYTGSTIIDMPVTLGTNNALPATTDVTITSSGTLDLAGYNQSIASLTATGNNATALVTNSNPGTANSVLTITGSSTTSFDGSITDATFGGTVGLTLNGTGSLAMTNSSSYAGPVNILGGRLDITIADPSAGTGLGAASVINIGGGTNPANAQLRFSGVGNSSSPATISYVTATHPSATPPVINLNSLGGYNTGSAIDTGAIRVSGGSFITLPDDIHFNANSAISVTASSQLVLSGNLSGTGTFISNGNGLTTLTGANTGYTGGTEVDAGTLNVSAGSMIGSGPLTVGNTLNSAPGSTGSATTLNLLNGGQTVGSLSGSITPASTGTNTAVINVPTGTLTVNQTTAGVYAGTVIGAGNLVKTGTSPLTIGGAETYSGTTNVSAGSLTIGNNPGPGIFNQISPGISIGSGAKLAIALNTTHSTRTLLTTPTPTFASTSSTLDLGDNDLQVPGGSLSALTAKVAQGYNLVGGANWTGAGITSSAAAADSKHLTALGIIQNNQDGPTVFTSTFDNAAVSASDVLVKYTYFGDANLDGHVDGSDYSLIDAGYGSHGSLTGWYNGDFNYDGVVDGSDYALLDNSFNNQNLNLSASALVATATAQVVGVAPTAVPEPSSIGLILAGLGILGRRNGRRK